jgi:hypothetical protein
MTDYAAAPTRQHFMHIVESDPVIMKYLAHPRLVAMAEELVGGPVAARRGRAAPPRPTLVHASPQGPLGTCQGGVRRDGGAAPAPGAARGVGGLDELPRPGHGRPAIDNARGLPQWGGG